MKNQSFYRIIAADDHPVFLEGIASLLEGRSDYKLIATCSDGTQTINAVLHHLPDFLLLDLSMHGASPIDIIEKIEKHTPKTHVIALTMNNNATTALALLELGLSGYVLKEEAFENVAVAMQRALLDECFISASIKAKIAAHQRKYATPEALTKKEKTVLTKAAQGMTNQEIADSVFISERTVRFHIANCCLKLQANGRTNAVAKALKDGVIFI